MTDSSLPPDPHPRTSTPSNGSLLAQPGRAAARPHMAKANALSVTEAYWTARCEGRTVPARADIDPRGLSTVLSHVFILERIAPGLARFRVAGSTLSVYAGMELRGMPLSALFRHPARAELAAALDACFDRPAIVEAKIDAHPLTRGAILPGQMILLPLADEAGQITRALGALSFDASPRTDAYRFDLGKPRLRPLWPEAPIARPVAAAAPAQPPLTGRPHLRLVYSAD